MSNVFFCSDHHLGHQNILKFTRADGSTPLRAFDSIEDHDEHIIAQHNSVVKPGDTCWFLGDAVINRKALSQFHRFNGRKRLILGNHDIFKNKDYFNAGFEDLHAFKKFDKFVATHIPVHSASISARWFHNVHGHYHANRVMLPRGVDAKTGDVLYSDKPDPRYTCVCMEQLDNYTPISLEDLNKRIDNAYSTRQ